MSPKTFKNKKESNDSKRPDSKHESGSAPFSKFIDDAPILDSDKVDATLKVDPEFSQDVMDDLPPPLRQDSEDEEVLEDETGDVCKATEYFDKCAKAVVKVFDDEGQVLVFPMLVRKFIDKKGYFKSITDISAIISELIDAELVRKSFFPILVSSSEYGYGYNCDLRVESYDKDLGDEFYLNDKNYLDVLFTAYIEMKILNLRLYVKGKLLKSLDGDSAEVPERNTGRYGMAKKEETVNVQYASDKHDDPSSIPMFRGRPIDISPAKLDSCTKIDGFATPPIVKSNPSNPRNSERKSSSPVSVYDDDDYLVKNPSIVCPFGQQSMQARIFELQAAAATSLPEVSSLPKLLKSHNVGYKEGDNAATWYTRFNNFCLMIGIYLPPPNSMQKNSEMGKEWDSNGLPFVFYSRFAKMEKLLSHILFTPDFFPKSMIDDLHLNPKPYNFLRLFMAMHSHAVSDLSDRVIKRPGPMRNGQTLSQYALAWVHYFDDETNVNGIVYSKFRQYCYFVDGVGNKYSAVKKFLEMEFTLSHDRKDKIPITLELRNLPSTIVSLCNVHGISISTGNASNIHQLNNDTSTSSDDCCNGDIGSDKLIQKLQSGESSKPSRAPPSNSKSSSSQGTGVQCWLCDGPHSFRQCKELVRVKGVCATRPQVRKHFRQLLLQKSQGNELKVLLDAPELFDDTDTSDDAQAVDDTKDMVDSTDLVNSLQILDSALFTTFHDGHRSSNVATFPTTKDTNRQLVCADEETDDASDQHFYILALDTVSSNDAIHLHSDNFSDQLQDFASFDNHNAAPDPSTSQIDLQDDFFISSSASLQQGSADLDNCCSHIHSVSFDAPTLSQVKYHRFTTQVDGGADRCTTPHRNLVDNIRPPDPKRGEPLYIYDAGKHKHIVEGVGNFRIESWVDGKIDHSLTIPCVYIPTIPSTLVNFRLVHNAIMYGEVSNLVTHDAVGTLIVGNPDKYVVHKIPLQIRGNRVYASNLLSIGEIKEIANIIHDQIAIVSDEATRLLWHARLGHLNFRALSSMHLSARGIPKFKQSHVTDQCETCLETKLRPTHAHW